MVYLIHFDTAYKHARHYIGFTDNLNKRLCAHSNGRGARLLQVIEEAGITYQIARIWEDGDRNLERKLKNRKKASGLCPICRGDIKKL